MKEMITLLFYIFFTPQTYPRGTNSSTVALIQYLGKPLGPSLKTWPR